MAAHSHSSALFSVAVFFWPAARSRAMRRICCPQVLGRSPVPRRAGPSWSRAAPRLDRAVQTAEVGRARARRAREDRQAARSRSLAPEALSAASAGQATLHRASSSSVWRARRTLARAACAAVALNSFKLAARRPAARTSSLAPSKLGAEASPVTAAILMRLLASTVSRTGPVNRSSWLHPAAARPRSWTRARGLRLTRPWRSRLARRAGSRVGPPVLPDEASQQGFEIQ